VKLNVFTLILAIVIAITAITIVNVFMMPKEIETLTTTPSTTPTTTTPSEYSIPTAITFSYSEELVATKFNVDKYIEELKKLENFIVIPREWFKLPVKLTPNLIDQLEELIRGESVNLRKLILMLESKGFAVIPSRCIDIVKGYRSITPRKIITVDSVLFVYQVLFDNLLLELEEKYLYDYLCSHVKLMLKSMIEDYNSLPGNLRDGKIGEALKYNIAYFSLLAKILKLDDVEMPNYVKDLVEAEYEKIKEANSMKISLLFKYREDYTQYKPRGHYTKSELLQRYFKAMMYMGRMTFNIKPRSPQTIDNTKRLTLQALIIAKNMFREIDGVKPYDLWEKIFTVTSFLVGKADDLTPLDYIKLAEKVYGKTLTYEKLANEALLREFMKEVIEYAKKVFSPRIISHLIYPSERPSLIGMRVMGQRFIIDGYIHQLLIFSNVPNRFMAKALDIPATMDSKRAWELLEDEKKRYGEPYIMQMEKARNFVRNVTLREWLSTVYNAWMYTLKSLLNLEQEEYLPPVMRNMPYIDKSLNTFLASWSQLRHDTILYAKQPYAELGVAIEREQDVGWVEPLPKTYARLLILAKITRDGLKNLNLLDEMWEKRLNNLIDLLEKLYRISLKEIKGEELTKEEQEVIKWYHHYLEQIIDNLDADPRIIADVLTDPNGKRVLEVGTGYFYKIIMLYPVNDKLVIGAGFVLSFYEFTHPMSQRLTNEEWRKIIKEYDTPEWTRSFILKEK